MQIIHPASFVARPWKNGGGITHEVIRVPADPEDFRWRVSMAEVAASGPFSRFTGHHRVMVLLAGDGLRLCFDGQRAAELQAAGDRVEFDGAADTACELVGGPCLDLNLMVSKSIGSPRSEVMRLERPRAVGLPGSTTVLFVIAGTALLANGDRHTVPLREHDCVIGHPDDRLTLLPLPGSLPLPPTAVTGAAAAAAAHATPPPGFPARLPMVFLATFTDDPR